MRTRTRKGPEEGPLKKSEDLLQLALRAAHAGPWAWDLQSGQGFWSEEFYLLLGVSPETEPLPYANWQRLVHPADRQRADQELQSAIAERRTIDLDFRIQRPDGAVRWLNFKGQAAYGPDGTPVRMVGLSMDITDRKQTEEALRKSEAELRLVADSAPVFIAHCGRDLRFRFVNAAYATRLGLRPEDLIGKTIPEVLGEEAYESFRQHVETVLRGERVAFEREVPYERIGRHVMHCLYVPELDDAGAVQGWVAVVMDVTERRQAEDSLRQAQKALKEADRRKDEFLAMLAHELRNPLAPIRNAVGVLERLDSPDPRLEKMREVIDRQTEQLTRLVDDLLDVSRITQGKIALHREVIDLARIVGRAIETSRPLIDANGHRLLVTLPHAPIWIEGDLSRLAQVVSNLLNNAAKYTETGGTIWLTAEYRHGEVSLRVRDTGVGMPAEVLPRIFDLFNQADRSLERAQGGLGIGLTIVRRLVEMHGGRVAAFSPGPGQGSEFVVHLPVVTERMREAEAHSVHAADIADTDQAAPDAPASMASAASMASTASTTSSDSPPAPSTGYRVLVVDDNQDSAESLEILLQGEGYEVRIAHDGPSGIEVAQAFHPHVVLLDIGLPGIDGYGVAHHLRGQTETQDAVLIALTGYGQTKDRQRTKAAGFDHHLVKPIHYDELASLIRSLVLV